MQKKSLNFEYIYNNCHHIRLTNAIVHENGFSGIFTGADDNTLRNTNIYVGYCKAYNNPGDPTITDNHSGNGIIYSETNNSIIEYCEAYNNGWDQPIGPPNGPVGIWAADADRIIIQYCISHDNKSTSGDGDGFDLDGGTTNSIIQYCYSYNNKYAGYLIFEYADQGNANNIVRYCVSENDGGPGFVIGTYAQGDLNDVLIYNNTIFNDKFPCLRIEEYGTGKVNSVKVYNNIFISGKQVPILAGEAKFDFKGNCYWRTDGSFNVFGYTDFNTWVNQTGQEKINGQIIGMHLNPGLVNPGAGEKLTDPTKLPELLAYMLTPDSPLINKGINLFQFGIDAGLSDLYGTAISSGGKYDIGAHEFKIFSTLTPAEPQTLSLYQTGAPLTVTENLKTTEREWKYTTTKGTNYQVFEPFQKENILLPMFSEAGKYYVVCVSVINDEQIVSNEVEFEVTSALNLQDINSFSDISVFPNPLQENLRISLPDEILVKQLKIYSLTDTKLWWCIKRVD